jgi:hypothetical protein
MDLSVRESARAFLVGVDRDRAWSKYKAFCVVRQSRSIIFFQSLRSVTRYGSSSGSACGRAGKRATLSTSRFASCGETRWSDGHVAVRRNFSYSEL